MEATGSDYGDNNNNNGGIDAGDNNNHHQHDSNSCDVLISGASVVIPKVGVVEADVLVESGRVKALAKYSSSRNIHASRRIDARGKYLMPGAIDPHVHYGVFTPIEEAARTESRSAAVGGITTMVRMLRLYGSYRSGLARQLEASRGNHYIDYSIHASILRPEQVDDIPSLKEAGISSLKIYMNLGAGLNHILMDLEPGERPTRGGQVDMTDDLLLSIVREGARASSTILVHAEDPSVCAEHMRKGRESGAEGLKAWSDCRPAFSEAASVAKVSELGRRFGSNLYFVHIGSTAALDAILAEREKGMSNYYIETCPHYLTHTTDFGKVTGKVVPPIRSKSDLQSMWSALRNGIVDTVGTDHVANRLEMKMGVSGGGGSGGQNEGGDIWSALAGFPGMATMLPVLLGEGVNKGRLGIERVAEVTSYNTARILGMYPRKGTIQAGSDADLVLVDLELEQQVTPELLQSYSDYTIYDGWKIKGWPVMTMVRGKIVMENGVVDGSMLGHGQFVPRPAAGAPSGSTS